MARRATPSSRARRESLVSAREWLGGIRLSGFTVIMLGLVVLGAFVLVPSASGYIDMRQRIAHAEASVEVTTQQIAELERERERWQDPAFIMSEARERLYYVEPGEIVFLIDDDLPRSEEDPEPDVIDADVSEEDSDWMGATLRSIVTAGLAEQAVSENDEVFQPTPEPTSTPGG